MTRALLVAVLLTGCPVVKPTPPLTPDQRAYVLACHAEVMVGVHGETYHRAPALCAADARRLYPNPGATK